MATLACLNCGKKFERKTNAQKHCSKKCALEYNRKLARGEDMRALSKNTFLCEWCGCEFGYKRKKKYCSTACRLAAQHRSPAKAKQETYAKNKKSDWASEMAKFNEEARKLGLSYGQYEARCRLEKRKVKECQKRVNQSSKN